MTVVRLRIPALWRRWHSLGSYDRFLIIITGVAVTGFLVFGWLWGTV